VQAGNTLVGSRSFTAILTTFGVTRAFNRVEGKGKYKELYLQWPQKWAVKPT